jgi:hypothetical protein
MRREQKPLETVFVLVRWVAIPNDGQGQDPDFAVIRIFEDERDDKWQVGFYSFDGDIMQIEEEVQTFTRSRNPSLGRRLE